MPCANTRVPPSVTMLAACLPLLFPATGHAATADGVTLEVLNCNDSGAGSLRRAVMTAPSGALIDLRGLACRRINLTGGAIEVMQDDLTLRGRGISAITIDGGLTASVLRHSGAGQLTLRGMTLQRGFHHAAGEAYGGCVHSQGAVKLQHARVRWCRALSDNGESEGGGVYAQGPLKVVHSQVLGNTAYHAAGLRAVGRLRVHHSWICSNNSPIGLGGGALADHGAEITYSTFSGNKGGALRVRGDDDTLVAHSLFSGNRGRNTPILSTIYNYTGAPGGSGRIINTTISGNSSNREIVRLAGSPSSIVNSTIVSNPMYARPIDRYCSPAVKVSDTRELALHLDSTIIANNTCNGEPADDLWIFRPATPAIEGANNLVMRPSNIALPPDTLQSDPMLEPLADNGGPTQTHALPPYSPAIDAGNNAAGLSYDQRGSGHPRVQGGQADIGAYER